MKHLRNIKSTLQTLFQIIEQVDISNVNLNFSISQHYGIASLLHSSSAMWQADDGLSEGTESLPFASLTTDLTPVLWVQADEEEEEV